MISYSQNFEDIILERFFKNINDGFYVDIGAADPTIDSVTRHFYEKGWRGINVEPSSILFKKLIKDRNRDINLNLVISYIDGSVDFFDLPNTGLSSIVKGIALAAKNNKKQKDYAGNALKEFNVITMQSRRLESVLNEFAKDVEINFLKIDVEGAEEEVIRSNNWKLFRPQILVVEATLPNNQELTHSAWEKLLLESDYSYVYFDGLNCFYLRNDLLWKKNFFNAPPNVFDDFITFREWNSIQRAAYAEERYGKEQEKVLHAEELARNEAAKASRSEEKYRLEQERVLYAEELARNEAIRAFRSEEGYRTEHGKVLYAEELARNEAVRANRTEEWGGNEAARAISAEAKIISIYESYSWKITKPFRFGLSICRYLAEMPKNIIKAIYIYLHRIIREIISVSGRRVQKIGFIAKPVEKVLRKFPRLFNRLYSIIISDNRNIPRFEQQALPDNEILSPRAQKIYHHLKRAIEKKKK